jgi:hypothetical protein
VKIFIGPVVVAIMFAGSPVGANETYSTEIQHLIDFVSHSGCDFVRNGKSHDPQEAVVHIQKKYRYFSDKIDSAENL